MTSVSAPPLVMTSREGLAGARALTPPVATIAFAALAAAAPFELLHPALVFPGQKLTNLECVVVSVIAMAASTLASQDLRRLARLPVARAAAVWLAVLLIASVAAPAHAANALKTTGRAAAGVVVLLLAAGTITSERRLAAVAGAALGTGVVVAAIALFEHAQVRPVLAWLTRFRPGLSVVGGEIRAGSTLQYPTIASMYFELVFAAGLGLLVAAAAARRWVPAALVGGSLLLVAEAVVLTLTRAGLITIAALLAVALAARMHGRGFDIASRAMVAVAAGVAALVALAALGGPLLLRVQSADDADWYHATYDVPRALTMNAGRWHQVAVHVSNTGEVTWRSDAAPPFYLAYHWMAANSGQYLQFDGTRTAFSAPVPPGSNTTVGAWVRPPDVPGHYRLAWDIVLEQRLWFGLHGSAPAFTDVNVVGGAGGAALQPVIVIEPPRALRRLVLWRMAARMLARHPLLGVGPDNFRLDYGPQAGLSDADDRVTSNNMYVEQFAGAGLLGGAAFLWLVAIVAAAAWRGIRRDATPLAIGMAAAVTAVLIHGMVDTFLTFTPTYILIWLACATPFCVEMAARTKGPDCETDAHRL